jgi:AraC family transcriptional regulator
MDIAEEYAQRILRVLIYIEEYVDQEIEVGTLARIACYSPFHFHRVFQAFVGETVGQYIKRLRIERAAGKLCYTGQPVTEIALDANFETPSAFTKAFKQFTGKSPKDFRAIHKKAQAFINKKLEEITMIKPDKIEKLSDLHLLFIRRCGSYSKTPHEAWQAMRSFIEANQLDKATLRRFCISHDNPSVTSEEKLRYDACILTNPSVKAKGEVGQTILKGGKYAIFTHLGAYEKIKDTFERIFLAWLPKSGEVYDETRPPFCEYLGKDEDIKNNPDKLITKIYIPLE